MLVTRANDFERVSAAIADISSLERIILVDEDVDAMKSSASGAVVAQIVSPDSVLSTEPDSSAIVETQADDPALLIYTSGTTGNPKGALHAHRVLVGHMPGVRITHERFPQEDDLMWTPAEWAWIGGLLDVLFPSLACGVPVVACAEKFSPELAKFMFDEVGVRNSFVPPTVLKQLRAKSVALETRNVRTLASGGERLGDELQAWSIENLGTHVNEFYGQTEMNIFVGQDRSSWEPAPGSMGRTIPGFQVAILDPDGVEVAPHTIGEICVLTPNPGEFIGYWANEEATRAKYHGHFLRTGDLGRMDAEGNIWFEGRADDVISSAGYRIGPGEIEEVLMGAPEVAMAAVVGLPDEIRGEIVAAFVVLRDGVDACENLRERLQKHVKKNLAFYQYPRVIEFVDSLPMTATGKIQRRLLRDTSD